MAQLMVLQEKGEGLNMFIYIDIPGYHEILELQRLGEHVVYFFYFFILQNAIKVSPKGICVLALSSQHLTINF